MTAVLQFPNRGSLNRGIAEPALIRPTPYSDMILRATDPFAIGIPSWLKEYRKKNLPNIMRGLTTIQLAEAHGIPTHFGILYAKLYTTKQDEVAGVVYRDYGMIGCRLVTNNGVAFIIDTLQNVIEAEIMRYHGIGTNATAEAQADSALGAELSTVYGTDNTRAAGTQVEGATANIFRTVGSNSVDGSATITEHGLLSQQATGGGVLFDRTVFAGIAVVSGNVLQTTYEWTLTAGG